MLGIRPWPLVLVCLTALGCRTAAPGTRQSPPPTRAADSGLGVAASDSAAQSAARFAQDFYDWYARAGERPDVAVRERASAFGSRLLDALRQDFAAQSKNPDEVVGLDWDPFLNTQDPCNPYRVGQVTRLGDTVLVAVKGTCTGAAPQPGPDVIAEAVPVAGTWQFVDFRHAADRGSLLQDLAALRRSRDSVRAARPRS